MDMKRILQALDTASTQPVEGANDMSNFLRIVKEAELNQPVAAASTLPPEQLAYNQLRAQLDSADFLRGGNNTYADVSPEVTASTNVMRTKLAQLAASLKAKGIDAATEYDAPEATAPQPATLSEGANPHKISLPVQMAMNHYQSPKEQPAPRAPSLLRKYFTEAEEEVVQAEADRKERLRMYSQKIANRVLVKESALKDKEDLQAKRKALHDLSLNKDVDQEHVKQRKLDLEKEAKKKKLSVDEGVVDTVKSVATKVGDTIANAVPKDFRPFDNETAAKNQQAMKEAPIEMTGDANDPVVHGHQKANPMSLKGRIQQARNQLKELANMAESDDLAVWQQICQLSKGGMFMGLEQNIEQVRHGIEQLAAKRKQGGVASRGINKNISERSVSQAQARTMAAAAHNPEFAKKTKIKPSVAKEFNQADKGKNIKSLPQRVTKKK